MAAMPSPWSQVPQPREDSNLRESSLASLPAVSPEPSICEEYVNGMPMCVLPIPGNGDDEEACKQEKQNHAAAEQSQKQVEEYEALLRFLSAHLQDLGKLVEQTALGTAQTPLHERHFFDLRQAWQNFSKDGKRVDANNDSHGGGAELHGLPRISLFERERTSIVAKRSLASSPRGSQKKPMRSTSIASSTQVISDGQRREELLFGHSGTQLNSADPNSMGPSFTGFPDPWEQALAKFKLIDSHNKGYVTPAEITLFFHKPGHATASIGLSLATVSEALYAVNIIVETEEPDVPAEVLQRLDYGDKGFWKRPRDALTFASFAWITLSKDLVASIHHHGQGIHQAQILQIASALKNPIDPGLGVLVNNRRHRHRVSCTAASTGVRSWHSRGAAGARPSIVEDELQVSGALTQQNMLEVVVSLVILINAITMGVSADVSPNSLGWEISEYLFKAFFLCEMVVKMRIFGFRVYFTGPEWGWNWFDFLLVQISLVDVGLVLYITWTERSSSFDMKQVSILKFARLTRLARVVRLLRFRIFTELKQMIQGIFAGLRVLFWAIIFFIICIYLLAIVLQSSVGDPNVEYLSQVSTVYGAMFTLFRCLTDGCTAMDGTPLAAHLTNKIGWTFWVAYMLVYLFMSIGLFNLIMAIFVENVQVAAHKKRQDHLNCDRDLMEFHLRRVFAGLLKKTATSGESSTPVRPTTFPVSSSIFIKACSFCCGRRKYEEPFLLNVMRASSNKVPTFGNDIPITQDVFNSWLQDPIMTQTLEELDIDSNAPMGLFDILDADRSGVLEPDELVDGLLSLRGPPEKSDSVATLLCVRALQLQISIFESRIMSELSNVGSQPRP